MIGTIRVLEIKITDPKDRKLLFTRMCELLSLNLENEAKKLKIKSTAAGLTVNKNHLFDFFADKKLNGTFDFKEATLEVECPEVESKGKTAIESPETIKETSVDTVEKEKETPKQPKEEAPKETAVEEEEEDTLFDV